MQIDQKMYLDVVILAEMPIVLEQVVVRAKTKPTSELYCASLVASRHLEIRTP